LNGASPGATGLATLIGGRGSPHFRCLSPAPLKPGLNIGRGPLPRRAGAEAIATQNERASGESHGSHEYRRFSSGLALPPLLVGISSR
jgi:hypothetical protein